MTRYRGGGGGVIRPRLATTAAEMRVPASGRGSTLARLVGAAGMLALTMVLFWLLTDDAFRVGQASVRIEGITYADEAAVRSRLAGLEREPNVFRVRARDIVGELSELPEVDAASAIVTLPAAVSVRVREREPIFVWSDGVTDWLVDEAGLLFAPDRERRPAALRVVEDARIVAPVAGLPSADAGATSAGATASPSPSGDEGAATGALAAGRSLPSMDLAVMRRLLAITPDMIGSASESLTLRVDAEAGYVLYSDRGWRAVFGHYWPNVQPLDVIPRQVQCLHWLLAAEGDDRLEAVRLAVSDEGCGTYTLLGQVARPGG